MRSGQKGGIEQAHTMLRMVLYSGSVVKTKIRIFYNELIRLISYKEQGEDIGALP